MTFVSQGKEKAVRTLIGSCRMVTIALFLAAVWTPVSTTINNDALIAETILPSLWDFLMYVLQFLMIWIAFADLIRFSIAYGWIGSIPFLIGCAVAYAIRDFGSSAVMAAILSEDYWKSFPYDLGSWGADLLLLAIGILIYYLVFFRRTDVGERESSLRGLTRFRQPNRLQKTVWMMVTSTSAISLASRLIYDIRFIGSPANGSDWFWMIFYYGMDLASVPIGYLVVVGILRIQKPSNPNPIS